MDGSKTGCLFLEGLVGELAFASSPLVSMECSLCLVHIVFTVLEAIHHSIMEASALPEGNNGMDNWKLARRGEGAQSIRQSGSHHIITYPVKSVSLQ